MEISILAAIVIIILLAKTIILRVGSFEAYAICLEYFTADGAFASYPLYEYELMENGGKITYRSRGFAIGYPRKGKRYKVFINKNNHNKVVGYSDFIVDIFLICIFSICEVVSLAVMWI